LCDAIAQRPPAYLPVRISARPHIWKETGLPHLSGGLGSLEDRHALRKWPLVLKRANQRSAHRRYACVMRPLRYSINVTLDGCCDHRAILPDEDLHRHAVENLDQADALLFGRVTYEMMEAAFRPPVPTGARPDWMEPFARTIDAAKKYVVSSTLDRADWNAELVRGDLGKSVQQFKRESGKGLLVGGVKLPLALAELGLIDEYEFVVHPRLAGHGPTLFAGLSKHLDLRLVSRLEFGSGAVAMRYEPRR
jgi:dihydrofolate reductase